MSKSQRILSGSLTKGSTATLSGSAQYFYQGVNAKTIVSSVGSLLPRMGSGDRSTLYRNGIPLFGSSFDDSCVINNSLGDMRGNTDDKVEQRVSFDFEDRSFGQPKEIPMLEPFADMLDYNPVIYINDQNEFMWPTNIWNLGSLPDHEYDGVIEPLDIRREILGDVDTRFEGHAIRGALVGAASERPWGSIEVSDTWSINEPSSYAFLDSPLVIPSKDPSKEINPLAIQAYQDIRQSSLNAFEETDYHSKIYSSIMAHNDRDIMTALRLLNSSSCENIKDPFLKNAAKGISSNEDVGSIIFNNTLVVGEY